MTKPLLTALLLALVAAAPAVRAGAASEGQAAEQAQRQTGGRVLSVEQVQGGYRVKVLTAAGEVRVVFIPGSGR